MNVEREVNELKARILALEVMLTDNTEELVQNEEEHVAPVETS